MAQTNLAKSSKDGEVVEIPSTPPRRMDLSMSESPDKQALQAEITALKAKMNFVLSQSRTALSSQDVTFRRLAKAYEQEARDINASELAQRTAELEAESAGCAVSARWAFRALLARAQSHLAAKRAL